MATSFATCEPGGFVERDFALIDATLPAFALAFKASIAIDTAHTLVTTYLGRDAAARILRGEIDRGQVKTVPTVLWFSDLAGFTRIADTLPRDQLLDLLNAYADCLVGVIHDHGGEVLKFMGDGILGVFSGAPEDACRRALDAAEAARAAIARLNQARSAAGLSVTGFTLALHEGEVLSGNVGSQERLDFTVVGPAVNELSRIQAMSRSLDQPILVSASFAAACGDQRARLVSVGRYALRGVGRPQELFTLDLAELDRPACDGLENRRSSFDAVLSGVAYLLRATPLRSAETAISDDFGSPGVPLLRESWPGCRHHVVARAKTGVPALLRCSTLAAERRPRRSAWRSKVPLEMRR